MLFVPGSTDLFSQDVFALKGEGVGTSSYGSSTNICGLQLCSEIPGGKAAWMEQQEMPIPLAPVTEESMMKEESMIDIEMKTETQEMDGIGFEFSVPQTIIAKKLVPINARVFDAALDAGLSHIDWAFSLTNSDGQIIHKSTTLHGHIGAMNFKISFPESGTYTATYSTLSGGPFMLGMPNPEVGQTRSLVTEDLFRFEEDPKNNFGSRTFEFTVDVVEPEQTIILEGSEPDMAYLVKMYTQPAKVIAGEPVTIILDVDDYNTGKDATHVDGLISITHLSNSGDQPDFPLPLSGAYHGHLGVLSLTQTFPKSGTVLLEVELGSIPYSKPLFGKASTQFAIQIFESAGAATGMMEKTVKENTVDIVGLESPFYMPNIITVSAGQTIAFDNVDANYHTVTSGISEHDGTFDSGLLEAGDSYELTLDEPGTYDYFCALHVGMKGIVIVS
jgi:plastocyanin